MDDKPKVRIENWGIIGSTLVGKVYEHPRFENGTEVSTSTILVRPKEPKEGDTIETRNTFYKLGKEYTQAE